MCRKLILLVSFMFVLGLVGDVSAQLQGQWSDMTIGGDMPAGSASYDAATDTWTVIGDGHDIWDNADDFHFVYQQLEGDGEITARVTDVGTGSNAWAKAGLMIRETLDEGSTWAMEAVTGGEGAGLAFQWRTTTNGGCGWTESTTPVVTPSDLPYWIRLVRTGDLFEGFHSPDGNTWTKEGEITVSMANQVYIGLARTSHATGELRSATFDNVTYVGNIHGQLTAFEPSPADGATHLATYVSLQWSAGATATSHDVYFGESFADVDAGTGGTLVATLPLGTEYQIVGFTNFPYPDGLVLGTDYYWRIDEVESGGTKVKGDVWHFLFPGKEAYNPVPADGAAFVPTDVTLTWTPGQLAVLHHVYFGDNAADVAAGTPDTDKVNGPMTTFVPGALEYEKTYYWRVDEFDEDNATHTGDVWSFKSTVPGLGTIVYERWDDITGVVLSMLKDHWKFPNNPDETDTLTQFSWDGADLSNYGARIYGWLYVPTDGDYTFWLAADDEGELWLSTDEDPENVELIANIPGWTDPAEWNKYASQHSAPVSLIGGEKYYVEALWKEEGGGDHCVVHWDGPGIPTHTVIPGSNLSPYLPVKAYGPNPGNNSTGAKQTGTLQWKPGIHAASHQVYFGTDEDAVRNATTASIEYKGTRTLGSESFEAGELPWESTFYWRIDEVNNLNPDSPWVGSVWKFTTAGYAIIDDFEDYGGDEVPLQEQIWYGWRDGLGYGAIGAPPYYAGNGTGAEVGDLGTLSYTEETIVHGGQQAMPYWYNNNKPDKFKYSEATMTMTDLRDWTAEGVKALSLWFRGYPASTGSFTVAGNTYTMTGSGADIWNIGPGDGQYGDEFHFAYKQLTGPGTIIARVESVEATHDWAKAGVMIRETLEPDSKHAFMCVTPASGVSSQGRPDTGAASFNTDQTGITAPHWVKLERSAGGDFTYSHSTDGSSWGPVTNATPQNIQMNANVYIGLAVTSHDAALTCEAVFSNVTISGNLTGQWMHQDIGILSNVAEPMYVAVANNTGQPAVEYHENPDASTMSTPTEWIIDLKKFADKGITLTDVNSLAIGFGDRDNPTPGGAGKMYFDDIRLYRPSFRRELVTFSQADLNRNGVVDFDDIEVMGTDWLNQGGSGLWYEYGEGTTWSLLPDFGRVETTKQGVINNFDITVRNQDDNFGFRFSGKINIAAAGDYTFYTTSDDGSQLFIDGALLVDNDSTHGMVEQSGTVTLTAGPHDIVVTMFEAGGGEGLEVEYEGPGIVRGPIPDDVLSLPAPVSDLNQDGVVNFEDYAILVDEWGAEALWPEW